MELKPHYSVKAVRGMHDLHGEELAKWQFLEKVVKHTLSSFGFFEIRTPALEKIEVFSKTVGSQTDIVEKQMYTVEKESEILVLRPEGTASFIRAVVEHQLSRPSHSQRFYYYLPMFRHERPQRGRFRQFFQFGAELINDPSPEADAEMIYMLDHLFRKLGITEFSIEINSVGCRNCRPEYNGILKTYFGSRLTDLCPQCQNRYERAPLRILDCKEEACKKMVSQAPLITSHLCNECHAHHQGTKSALSTCGVQFKENPNIVRGLDYYCKTAFEFTSSLLGAQSALCGGGRYDGLAERFGGTSFPAVGWAFGVERLIMVLDGKNTSYGPRARPFFYFAPLGEQAYEILWPLSLKLKAKGIWVEIGQKKVDRKLKSILKDASQSESRFALILGEDELKKSEALLKNLDERSQESIPLDGIEDALFRRCEVAI